MNGKTEINGLKMEIIDVIFREPVRIEDERGQSRWGKFETIMM